MHTRINLHISQFPSMIWSEMRLNLEEQLWQKDDFLLRYRGNVLMYYTCIKKKTPIAAMCSPDWTCWKPTNLICIASSIPRTYMQL